MPTDPDASEPVAPAGTIRQADDLLPPVDPPTGRFILQLFVIPLLIVCVIVGVWLMFSWLARSGEKPEKLVADIERLNHASWQKALTLANFLRDPRQAELRRDPQLAGRLAELLGRQIENGRSDRDHVWLRMYVCRALGEFEIGTGLPALAVAAAAEKDPVDVTVRRAAVQAIGMLATKLEDDSLMASSGAAQAVLDASREYGQAGEDRQQRELLRSTATFVLGVLPGEAARERLGELLDDPGYDVRYNAAVGLARHADSRSVPLLAEMLAPPADALLDPDPQLTPEQQAGQAEWKRSQLILTALRSIGLAATRHPELDLGDLPQTVASLAANRQESQQIQIEAQEVLRSLQAAGRR